MIHTGKLKLRIGTSGLSDFDRLQVAVPIHGQARPPATWAGFPAHTLRCPGMSLRTGQMRLAVGAPAG